MLLHTNTKLLDRHFRYNKAAKMTEFRACRRSKVPYVIPPGQGVKSGGASTPSSARLKNKIWDDVIHLFCRLNRGKYFAIHLIHLFCRLNSGNFVEIYFILEMMNKR